MNKIVNAIPYLIFGEWNGVQNFVAPTLLLFMFDQYNFINWITALLTYQRFYIPLFVYIIVIFSIVFLCLKVLVQWKRETESNRPKANVRVFNDVIFPYIIKLHKWLFVFFTVFVLIYVIKGGYGFIYRESFPLFTVYFWTLRIGTAALTLYTFALLEVAIPIIRKGRSLNQAQSYFHLLIIKRWKRVLPILIVQLLWIYVSVLLFTLAINQLQNINDLGYFTTNGKPLEIVVKNVNNVGQFVNNVIILLGAFMISNLLYSPLMLLVNKGFHHFKLNLKNL